MKYGPTDPFSNRSSSQRRYTRHEGTLAIAAIGLVLIGAIGSATAQYGGPDYGYGGRERDYCRGRDYGRDRDYGYEERGPGYRERRCGQPHYHGYGRREGQTAQLLMFANRGATRSRRKRNCQVLSPCLPPRSRERRLFSQNGSGESHPFST